MNSPPFDIVAYGLLAGLGVLAVGFLANVLVDDVKRRKLNREAAATSVSGPTAGGEVAQTTREPELEPVPVPATEPAPPEPAPAPAPPEPSPQPDPKSRWSAKRRRLQELLDRGISLQRNAPSPLGPSFAFLRPTTTKEDVVAWEAAVEAELMDRPKELALFRYERPRSPLVALNVASLENPLRRRLEQRNEQLSVIIKRTP